MDDGAHVCAPDVALFCSSGSGLGGVGEAAILDIDDVVIAAAGEELTAQVPLEAADLAGGRKAPSGGCGRCGARWSRRRSQR